MKQSKSILLRLTALCLILAFCMPVNVSATTNDSVAPCASYYLDAYNTYICDLGSGKIQIWYEVAATGKMDEVGVLSIDLYEVNSNGSLTYVTSFLHEDYDSMLATDDNYIYSYVSYQGSSSKTYKAQVCFWAGKNGSGDTRYMWATE